MILSLATIRAALAAELRRLASRAYSRLHPDHLRQAYIAGLERGVDALRELSGVIAVCGCTANDAECCKHAHHSGWCQCSCHAENHGGNDAN